MKGLWLLVCLLFACGAEETLVVDFALEEQDALNALAVLHPSHVRLDEGQWIGPSGEFDFHFERVATLPSLEGYETGKTAVVSDVSLAPVTKVELRAEGRGLGDAVVPSRAGDLARVVWREGGEELFAKASTLALRVTLSVELERGQSLAGTMPAGVLRLEVPVRKTP